MHAHRCKECTLYRCDVAGAVCSECGASVPDGLEAIVKTYAAGIAVTYTLGSGWANPQQAPGLTGSVFLTIIPGDNKHNARQAANALMEVDWGAFSVYCASVGVPGSTGSKSSLSELHQLLKGFARS